MESSAAREDNVASGYLLNAWYVVAHAGEVSHAPRARKVLGRDIVILRIDDGIMVAAGRCPHRFAPLHMGAIVEGTIECPYHGLRFDRSGKCVHNPDGDGRLPAGARLRVYPAVERWGMVWAWMGDAGHADATLIPHIDFLADATAHRPVSGVLPVAANYRHVIDNAMDTAHIAIVHRQTLHSDGLAKGTTVVARHDDGSVSANRRGDGGDIPVAFRPFWKSARGAAPETVTHWADARWFAPCIVTNDVGITAIGGTRDDGVRTRLFFCFTPETDATTHYFWTVCRDFLLDDEAFDQEMAAGIEHVLTFEDGIILSAIQAAIGDGDLFSHRPALMASDRALVEVRRELDRMVAAERLGSAAPPQARQAAGAAGPR